MVAISSLRSNISSNTSLSESTESQKSEVNVSASSDTVDDDVSFSTSYSNSSYSYSTSGAPMYSYLPEPSTPTRTDWTIETQRIWQKIVGTHKSAPSVNFSAKANSSVKAVPKNNTSSVSKQKPAESAVKLPKVNSSSKNEQKNIAGNVSIAKDDSASGGTKLYNELQKMPAKKIKVIFEMASRVQKKYGK